jgi:hypothetical protein
VNDDELTRRLAEALLPEQREPPVDGLRALHAAIDKANLAASHSRPPAWLMPAAAALVVVGGVAIAIGRGGDDRPAPPANAPSVGPAVESTEPIATSPTSAPTPSTTTSTSTSTTSTTSTTVVTGTVSATAASNPASSSTAAVETDDDDPDVVDDDNSGPGGGGDDGDGGHEGPGGGELDADTDDDSGSGSG